MAFSRISAEPGVLGTGQAYHGKEGPVGEGTWRKQVMHQLLGFAGRQLTQAHVAPSFLMYVMLLFKNLSFPEIELTNHKIRPFKVYNFVIFGIVQSQNSRIVQSLPPSSFRHFYHCE